MFMDLKSSTTIAEVLGEAKYFEFLNDTFRIVTTGIVNCKGEIYQYVCDEVVISWRQQDGIKDARCISCFYEMTRLLTDQSEFFEKKYGHQPTFKAGLHSGHVIAGEMGVLKREIAYSGDVLNTTARIQSKCNELGVLILISKHLIGIMGHTVQGYDIRDLGELALKGKVENVDVVTIET